MDNLHLPKALSKPHEALAENQDQIKANNATEANWINSQNLQLKAQNLGIYLVVIPVFSAAYALNELKEAAINFIATVLHLSTILDTLYGEDPTKPQYSLNNAYEHIAMALVYVVSSLGSPLAGLIDADLVLKLNQKLGTDQGQIAAYNKQKKQQATKQRQQVEKKEKQQRIEQRNQNEEVQAPKPRLSKAERKAERQLQHQAKMEEDKKVAKEKKAVRQKAHEEMLSQIRERKTQSTPNSRTDHNSMLTESLKKHASEGDIQLSEETVETTEFVSVIDVTKAEESARRKVDFEKQLADKKAAEEEMQKKIITQRTEREIKSAGKKLENVKSECNSLDAKIAKTLENGKKANKSDGVKRELNTLSNLDKELKELQEELKQIQMKQDKNNQYKTPEEVKTKTAEASDRVKESLNKVKVNKETLEQTKSEKIAAERASKEAKKADAQKQKAYDNAGYFGRGLHNLGLRAIKV